MLNLTANRKKIIGAIFFSIFIGMFVSKLLPAVTSNILFVFLIPVIGLFFILMTTNVKASIIFLLFLRLLLDPLLDYTKINMFGQEIGIGSGLNLLIIFLLVILISKNPRRIAGNSFIKCWYFFLFICAVSVSYSPVPGRAARLFLNLTSYMAVAAIPFFIIDKKEDCGFWIKILLFSSFLPVIFANVDLLMGGHHYTFGGMRIKGTFMHPNVLAFYLVFVIALIFYILKWQKIRLSGSMRNILKIYLIDLLILLIFTKTRGAWIACWSIFALYGFLQEKKYLVLIILSSFIFVFHPEVMARIKDLFSGSSATDPEGANSFTWRMNLWKSSLQHIEGRVLFGNGLASFREMSRDFFTGKSIGTGSHNAYLELLFETGLIGLVGYLSIYISLLKKMFQRSVLFSNKVSPQKKFVAIYIISYMIVSFADNLLYYLAFNWCFWFFIGVTLRSIQFDSREEDIRNNTII